MGNLSKPYRMFMHVLACILLIASLGAVTYSLLTHKWQLVTVKNAGKEVYHEHGLLMDCLESSDTRTCDYRNELDNEVGSGHRHPIKEWKQKATNLLICSIAVGLVGLIFGLTSMYADYCSYNKCIKSFAVIWTSLSFASSALSISAIMLFYTTAVSKEEVVIAHGNESYSHSFGWSFYMAVISAGGLLISSIFAAISTMLLFVIGSGYDQGPIIEYVPHNSYRNGALPVTNNRKYSLNATSV